MVINWMKFAETMSAVNPYGPVIMCDGSVYSPDGRLLVGPNEAADQQAAPRPVRVRRQRRWRRGRRLSARGSLRSAAAPAGTR